MHVHMHIPKTKSEYDPFSLTTGISNSHIHVWSISILPLLLGSYSRTCLSAEAVTSSRQRGEKETSKNALVPGCNSKVSINHFQLCNTHLLVLFPQKTMLQNGLFVVTHLFQHTKLWPVLTKWYMSIWGPTEILIYSERGENADYYGEKNYCAECKNKEVMAS